MHKFLVITLALFSSSSFAMLTFDAQNFAQNMKIYAEQLNSLNQLKQQTEYHIAEYKALHATNSEKISDTQQRVLDELSKIFP